MPADKINQDIDPRDILRAFADTAENADLIRKAQVPQYAYSPVAVAARYAFFSAVEGVKGAVIGSRDPVVPESVLNDPARSFTLLTEIANAGRVPPPSESMAGRLIDRLVGDSGEDRNFLVTAVLQKAGFGAFVDNIDNTTYSIGQDGRPGQQAFQLSEGQQQMLRGILGEVTRQQESEDYTLQMDAETGIVTQETYHPNGFSKYEATRDPQSGLVTSYRDTDETVMGSDFKNGRAVHVEWDLETRVPTATTLKILDDKGQVRSVTVTRDRDPAKAATPTGFAGETQYFDQARLVELANKNYALPPEMSGRAYYCRPVGATVNPEGQVVTGDALKASITAWAQKASQDPAPPPVAQETAPTAPMAANTFVRTFGI